MLLMAPAGFGKTALLASIASEWKRFAQLSTATHLAWYRLDSTDDDAAVFVRGLLESVRRVVPGFGSVAQAALQGTADARGQLRRLMALFLDELHEVGPLRVFLVLDGLHHLKDRAILEPLEQVLLEPDSPLRLIVSTRTDPRFYLSAFRARDALVELHADDLRFTEEEMRRLVLKRSGRRVAPIAVDALVRGTEGWPSAANLASLIVAREGGPLPFSRLAPTEHGYGLLVRELLAGFPQEKRDALLRGSLLARLDHHSCREAAGVSDPDGFLSFVEEASLPVVRPAGADLPLYLEPLFRSALEQELARVLLNHEYQELRRRVASYYREAGEPSEALQIYLSMGAYEEAAALLESVVEGELSRGHLDIASRWLRALPAVVRDGHPGLMVQESRLLLARDRLEDARVLLVAARPGLETSRDVRSRAQQLGGLSAVRLLEGRYPDAVRLAREGLEQLPAEESSERAELFWLQSRGLELVGDLAGAFSAAIEGLLEAERGGQLSLAVRALLQAGRLAHLRGDYGQALALSGRAVQRASLLGQDILAVNSAGAIASTIYMERDQLEEASMVAETLLAVGRKLRDEAGQVRAQLARAAILERLGEVEVSRQMLAGAMELLARLPARLPEHTLARQMLAASLFRQGKRKGGLAQAHLALRAAQDSSHPSLVDQCSLMVAAGEMTGLKAPFALARLRRMNDIFRRSDNRRWLSAGLRLLAQGYARLGLRWQARAHLRTSLALAAEESWVGMPLGMPSRRGRLLALAVREGVAHKTAATLLGLDPSEGGKALAPLLAHKDPRVKARAEEAAKGMEKGLGRVPRARLVWPGLPSAAEEPFPSVALFSLGGLQGTVEEQPGDWPSVDAMNLAAYLLVNRAIAVPREQLLRDLWPTEAPAVAHLRLQESLYRIRETLGPGYPPVDPDLDGRGVYRWDGSGCYIDSESFRRLLGRIRQQLEFESPPVLSDGVVSLLEEAVHLYRGEFLAGFDFPWSEPQREELRALLLWATRLLIDHYMALRQWRDAIWHGLKSLRSDPLQEDVVRDLMLCYFRIGDRRAVDVQYREVKRLLAKHRGVWPSEETRKLRLRLLGDGAGWVRYEGIQPRVLVVGGKE